MSNGIKILDGVSNLYITVWVGAEVLKTFKFTSFGDITTINARYTNIGTTRFVSIIINEINENGLTINHTIPAVEGTKLSGRMEVYIYNVDNNLEEIGFIEKDYSTHLYNNGTSLTESESAYLSKIDKIEIVQHGNKPDDIFIYHNKYYKPLSYVVTNEAISYIGLCDITNISIMSDLMDYYCLSFKQDVDEEYFFNILHHFTPCVEIESI